MDTSGRAAGRQRAAGRLPWLLLLLALPEPAGGAPTGGQELPPQVVAEVELADAKQLFLEGRYADALPLALRARELYEQALGEGPELAEALGLLGDLQLRSGEFAGAERTLQRSLAIRYAKRGDRSAEAARSLNALGALFFVQGMYGRAQLRFERALAIREAVLDKDDPDIARSLHNLANLFIAMGLHGRAESLLRRELKIWERTSGDRRAETALALTSLANVYRLQGAPDDAQALLERALELRRAALGPRHPDVARTLSALAEIERIQGRYAEAREHLLEALSIREGARGPRHLEVAFSNYELGAVDWSDRKYASAIAFLERATEINEEWVRTPEKFLAYTLDTLPHVYAEHGLYNRGEPYYDRGLTLLEPGPADDLRGNPLAYAAVQGLLGKAERMYLRMIELHETLFGANHPLVAEDVFNLARLYLIRGMYDRAEPLLRRWLDIGEAVLGADHPFMARSLFDLARLLVVRNRTQEALPLLERGLGIWGKRLHRESLDFSASRMSSFLHLFRDDEEMLYEILRRHPDDARVSKLALTAALLLKGRSLEEVAAVAGAITQGMSAADVESLERLRALRTRLAEQALDGPGPLTPEEHRQRLQDLSTQCEALEADLARRSAPLRALAALPPAEQIVSQVAAGLPAGSALVEVVEYSSRPLEPKPTGKNTSELRYLALVLFPGGQTAAADLGPAAAIDRAVTRLRDVLAHRKDTYLPAARALHELAFRPLLPLLGDTRRLFLAPDGQLSLVPFAALHDGRQFLIDAFDITYLTSGKDLLPRSAELGAARPLSSESAVVVMADPDYGAAPPEVVQTRSAWGRLPGTRREAELIRELFPEQTRLFLGAEVRKDVLLKLEAPAVLHLGTHAVFLGNDVRTTSAGARGVVAAPSEAAPALPPDPLLRSLLALSAPRGEAPGPGAIGAGMATALELAGMNLWGTQLVVLSACDTGVGEVKLGQGVYGLRRALFIAGAETVVMSLWHVDDDATSALMARYYRDLAASGGRTTSLREAMLFVRARKPHPYYWAGFIASGSDAPLSLPARPPPGGK